MATGHSIDEEIPLPEVVPLEEKKVKEFVRMEEEILKILPVWANVHLKALNCHPQSPDLHFTLEKIGKNVFEKSEYDYVPDFKDILDSGSVLQEAARRMKLMDPRSWRLDWSGSNDDIVERKEKKTSCHKIVKELFGDIYEKLSGKVKVDPHPKKNSPVDEPSSKAKWFTEMTQHIQMCQVCLLILRKQFENFKVQHGMSHSADLKDGSYEGESANSLNARMEIIKDVQVIVFNLVQEIEYMLHKEDLFQECIERYKRGFREDRKVVEKMSAKKTVLSLFEEEDKTWKKSFFGFFKKKENMTKRESVEDMMSNVDNAEIDLLDHKMIKQEPRTDPSTKSSSQSSETPVPLIGSSDQGSLGDHTNRASALGQKIMDEESAEGDESGEGDLDKKLGETSMN